MNVLRDLLATLVMAIVGPLGMFLDVLVRGMESESLLDNLMACLIIFAIIMICCLIVTALIYSLTLRAVGLM